jgi:glutamate 5-kinase
MAGDSAQGTGGMSAKVAAAKIALNAKCVALILNNEFNSLDKIIDGNQMTWFIPDNSSHAKYIKF